MSFLCFFGIHRWGYGIIGKLDTWKSRMCVRCSKKQVACYDGTYGETIWENLDASLEKGDKK